MAGEKRTVTIREVNGDAWQKPGSTQNWHTVVINEHPSEPIKFIQDTAKGAPAPEVGKSYEGMVYSGDKGLKFYASGSKFTQNKSFSGGKPKKEYQPRDDSAIQAQWAIGQANQMAIAIGNSDIKFIEDAAHDFYALIEKVKQGRSVTTSSPDAEVSREENKALLAEIPF